MGSDSIELICFTAREEAARYLVDYGVPVGTFDDTGMSTIAHMVEKMPHIAVDALNQFVIDDTAFRKSYFFLNYLEYDPIKYAIKFFQTLILNSICLVFFQKLQNTEKPFFK